MSTIGGFTEFAALRLRDHRPGNGEYELPPGFGPGSESSKRSILGKYPAPVPQTGVVGPGEYPIPGYIGTGRYTTFGRPNPDFTPVSTATQTASPARVITEPKQYSMALMPDTPAYSMYGKLKGQWEYSPTGEVGPGEYHVPSMFEHSKYAPQPGAHFGIRNVTAEERELAQIPGPGTYTIPGIAEEINSKKYYTPIPHRHRKKTEATPGPGAYDSDPYSISARTTPSSDRYSNVSTFGGRFRPKENHTAGPGPAAYNVDRAAEILERHRRHAPKIMPPTAPVANSPTHTKKNIQRLSSAPVTTLPSEFDYDYRKGYSMLGRWKPTDPGRSNVGPGSYDVNTDAKPTPIRFASKPFDPYAAAALREEMEQKERGIALNQRGSGPLGDVNYSQVERHTRGAVMGASHDMHVSAYDNGVPGPGHYQPNYDIKKKGGDGTLFYKGDFVQKHKQNETLGDGPGAHYNDYTPYSQSIAGDNANRKGYTFGIRYPARATHQVAPPRDEQTNINCVYPDEMTFETHVKLPTVKH